MTGGGDSADDEALVLAQYADRVLLFHRRDELRAQKELVDRVLAEPKIEVVWNTVIEEVLGENTVSGVSTTNIATGEKGARELTGLFVYVGLAPNGNIVDGLLETDGGGHIPVKRIHGNVLSRCLCGRGHPPAFSIAVGIGSGRRRNRSHRSVPIRFRKVLGLK